jgi:hypothetical protein
MHDNYRYQSNKNGLKAGFAYGRLTDVALIAHLKKAA